MDSSSVRNPYYSHEELTAAELSKFAELERNFIEADNNIQNQGHQDRNQLFHTFQKSAQAVAKVYMTRRSAASSASAGPGGAFATSSSSDSIDEEDCFKAAAQFTTALYKEGTMMSEKAEYNSKAANRRGRELLSFLKRKKRFRRDELLNFLTSSYSSGCPSFPQQQQQQNQQQQQQVTDDILDQFANLANINQHNKKKRRSSPENDISNSNKKFKFNQDYQ